MSKKLSKDQKRNKKLNKKKSKKRRWEERCVNRLIEAAEEYNRLKTQENSEVFDKENPESDDEEQVVGE